MLGPILAALHLVQRAGLKRRVSGWSSLRTIMVRYRPILRECSKHSVEAATVYPTGQILSSLASGAGSRGYTPTTSALSLPQRQLYLSLVRPHLEYAAPVWSPYLHKDINMLERTQQFASKMCTKIRDSSYNELLERLHLPTLAQHRLHLSLCFMYRTIHKLLYFPPNID